MSIQASSHQPGHVSESFYPELLRAAFERTGNIGPNDSEQYMNILSRVVDQMIQPSDVNLWKAKLLLLSETPFEGSELN